MTTTQICDMKNLSEQEFRRKENWSKFAQIDLHLVLFVILWLCVSAFQGLQYVAADW